MPILPDTDIFALLRDGALAISPLDISQIQPATVDLRLGAEAKIYTGNQPLDLEAANFDNWKEITIGERFMLERGVFLQAFTLEKIVIPQSLNAKIYGKNSLLMAGLEVVPAYINPGFAGRMPLAVKNIGPSGLTISVSMKICQIEFSYLAQAASRPYPERYKPCDIPSDSPVLKLFTKGVDKNNAMSRYLREQISALSK